MKVVLASESPLKADAVREGFRRAGIEHIEIVMRSATSGVPNQPWGSDEIMTGAVNRLRAAFDPEADYTVAIENGLTVPERDTFTDAAFVVIASKNNVDGFGRWTWSVDVPPVIAREALGSENRFLTWGDVLAARTECDSADPHVVVTEGRTNRTELIASAILRILTVDFGTKGNGNEHADA